MKYNFIILLLFFASFASPLSAKQDLLPVSQQYISLEENSHSEQHNSDIEQHSEPDPYKIHKEYINEPWRLSSSYKILERYFIILFILNLSLFTVNRFREKRYYTITQKTDKNIAND